MPRRRRTRSEAAKAPRSSSEPKPRRTRSEAVQARKLARVPAAERTWPDRLGRPLTGAEADMVTSARKPHDVEGIKVIGFKFADGTVLCRACEGDLDALHDRGCGFHMHIYNDSHKPDSATCDSCNGSV